MFSKTLKSSVLLVFSFSLMTRASDCNYYTRVGRSLMFDGTLSGMRLAYETFDNGLNDPGCPDCSACRELRFWHAVTGTAMLIIRDDSGSLDSTFELLKQFDIEVLGDCWAPYFGPLGLDFDTALNQYDAYEIPAGAPDANEVRNIIDTSMIPEIEAIIADLNSISDSPGDRFRIFLEPEETRIFFHPNSPVINPGSPDYDPNSRFLRPLEMDYGEVLLLKGLLMALKAQLQARIAYDLYIDANDMLIEKDYGDSFNMNADLLDPHPDFLKVLPTANDSNDGAAVLAQTRQDWIDVINYYLDTINYITSEDDPVGTDPQDDEFLYIDPNDKDISDNVNERLETLRDSLVNDTVETCTIETTKKYDIQCSGSYSIGQLELVYDLIGLGSGGSLTLEQCTGAPSRWAFDNFSIEGDELYIEMDFEGSDINYRYAQSLNWANSVLLTPIDCGPNPNTYKCDILADNLFSSTGTAQGWQGYSQTWSYTLPFTFPYFGTTYTSVYVCTNGFLDFTNPGSDCWNWQNQIRIQPFGTYLRTDGGGSYDIYIDQPGPNEVKFRWDADNYGNQCNLSVSLFSDGSIRFDYGPGNNDVWPEVGISNGSYDSSIPLGSGWGGWGSGLFTGTISQDQNSIADATFEYWGDISGTLTDLSGQIISVEIEDVNFDLNPVFGSSARYPVPVNPRDLLPVFDEWNGAQPGTMGHGLGDDATLGGILPDMMTQYDWQLELDLQPGGLFYLQEIEWWQKGGSFVDVWSEHQLIFEDPMSDTWEDVNNIENVDIDRLYMGYDNDALYGAIILHDYNSAGTGQAYYNLYLSYTDETDSLGSIKLEINLNAGVVQGWICHMNDSYGYPYWDCIEAILARMGENGIEFSVPWYSIPSHLPGRFISLNVRGSDSMGYNWNGEDNQTHLKIGEVVGSISGTVSYNANSGAPIFVQAYTDHRDPEGSLVASTVITAPGPYTLEGIGLGWEGYVRAFTPLFGFNVFDLKALTIQDSAPVFLWLENLDGVDLVLNNPILLEKDVCVDGVIDPNYDQDWYSFYAVQGGIYTLDVNRLTSQYAYMTLYDRNGYEELAELYVWQTQQINWLCSVSGRYYIKVTEPSWQPEGGTYKICMTSNVTCPRSDIGASDWAGVEDCKVDFYDLTVLISHWLDSCAAPYWCDESDFNESHSVNFVDFAVLANEWLRDGTP